MATMRYLGFLCGVILFAGCSGAAISTGGDASTNSPGATILSVTGQLVVVGKAEGKSLAGFFVKAIGPTTGSAITGEGGEFTLTFDAKAGVYQVSVDVPNTVDGAKAQFTVDSSQAAPPPTSTPKVIDVSLAKVQAVGIGKVSGLVMAGDKALLVGAGSNVFAVGENSGTGSAGIADVDGKFALQVRCDETQTLNAIDTALPEYGMGSVKGVQAIWGEEVKLADLKLPVAKGAFEVAGRVLAEDIEDGMLADIEVVLGPVSAKTAADGSFVLPAMKSGIHKMTAKLGDTHFSQIDRLVVNDAMTFFALGNASAAVFHFPLKLARHKDLASAYTMAGSIADTSCIVNSSIDSGGILAGPEALLDGRLIYQFGPRLLVSDPMTGDLTPIASDLIQANRMKEPSSVPRAEEIKATLGELDLEAKVRMSELIGMQDKTELSNEMSERLKMATFGLDVKGLGLISSVQDSRVVTVSSLPKASFRLNEEKTWAVYVREVCNPVESEVTLKMVDVDGKYPPQMIDPAMCTAFGGWLDSNLYYYFSIGDSGLLAQMQKDKEAKLAGEMKIVEHTAAELAAAAVPTCSYGSWDTPALFPLHLVRYDVGSHQWLNTLAMEYVDMASVFPIGPKDGTQYLLIRQFNLDTADWQWVLLNTETGLTRVVLEGDVDTQFGMPKRAGDYGFTLVGNDGVLHFLRADIETKAIDVTGFNLKFLQSLQKNIGQQFPILAPFVNDLVRTAILVDPSGNVAALVKTQKGNIGWQMISYDNPQGAVRQVEWAAGTEDVFLQQLREMAAQCEKAKMPVCEPGFAPPLIVLAPAQVVGAPAATKLILEALVPFDGKDIRLVVAADMISNKVEMLLPAETKNIYRFKAPLSPQLAPYFVFYQQQGDRVKVFAQVTNPYQGDPALLTPEFIKSCILTPTITGCPARSTLDITQFTPLLRNDEYPKENIVFDSTGLNFAIEAYLQSGDFLQVDLANVTNALYHPLVTNEGFDAKCGTSKMDACGYEMSDRFVNDKYPIFKAVKLSDAVIKKQKAAANQSDTRMDLMVFKMNGSTSVVLEDVHANAMRGNLNTMDIVAYRGCDWSLGEENGTPMPCESLVLLGDNKPPVILETAPHFDHYMRMQFLSDNIVGWLAMPDPSTTSYDEKILRGELMAFDLTAGSSVRVQANTQQFVAAGEWLIPYVQDNQFDSLSGFKLPTEVKLPVLPALP